MDQIKGVFSAIDKKIAEKAREAAQDRLAQELGISSAMTPEQKRQAALSRMAPTASNPATPQTSSWSQQGAGSSGAQASQAARRNTSSSSNPSTPPASGRANFQPVAVPAAAVTPTAAGAVPEASPGTAVYNDLQSELADIYGGLAAAASHSVTTPASPTFLSPGAPPPGGHGLDIGLLVDTLRTEILARCGQMTLASSCVSLI